MSYLTAQALAGHVQAELFADVSAIQPGKPFWLGVHITIDPGWHVYWKNPGDAGLPTSATLSLPDGFTAGPLEFPTPSRFEQPGDIVVFGYENSVMLLTQSDPSSQSSPRFSGTFPGRRHLAGLFGHLYSGQGRPRSNSRHVAAILARQPGIIRRLDQPTSRKWRAIPTFSATSVHRQRWLQISWDHPARLIRSIFFPEAPAIITSPRYHVKSAQDTTVVSFTAQPSGREKSRPDQPGSRSWVILTRMENAAADFLSCFARRVDNNH